MFAGKTFIFMGVILAVTVTTVMTKGMLVGGAIDVSDLSSVERELNVSLTKLAAGDGPNYKLSKVYSATRQVVAGTLTRIVADLVDKNGKTKKCKVSVWSRPWLPNGIEVTIECDGQPKEVGKHNAHMFH